MTAPLPAPRPLSLMLVAGEPSGDQLGGQLMAALKTLAPDVVITGMGGPAMAAQGLKSLFPLSDTAVMGLREVARPQARRRRCWRGSSPSARSWRVSPK